MNEGNENMIELISSTATEIQPEKKRTKNNEIWKNDDDLNRLITERPNVEKGSFSFRIHTKQIKKRVNILKNDKLRMMQMR